MMALIKIIFRIFRWLSVAVMLLSLGGLMSLLVRDYPLLVSPEKSSGVVVGNQQRHLSVVGKLGPGNMFSYRTPVIEFMDASGKMHRFESRYGDGNAYNGMPVRVLYDKANPKRAMMDRDAFHNWLGEYIALFCLLASGMGVHRFSSRQEQAAIDKLKGTFG